MPKGQSPSKRMDARRSRLNKEVDEMSGRNLPHAKYSDDDPLPKRAAGAAVNTLSDARAKQMRKQAGSRLTDAEAKMDKIDISRENEAQRSGRAKAKMKAQSSGNGFKGTF